MVTSLRDGDLLSSGDGGVGASSRDASANVDDDVFGDEDASSTQSQQRGRSASNADSSEGTSRNADSLSGDSSHSSELRARRLERQRGQRDSTIPQAIDTNDSSDDVEDSLNDDELIASFDDRSLQTHLADNSKVTDQFAYIMMLVQERTGESPATCRRHVGDISNIGTK